MLVLTVLEIRKTRITCAVTAVLYLYVHIPGMNMSSVAHKTRTRKKEHGDVQGVNYQVCSSERHDPLYIATM